MDTVLSRAKALKQSLMDFVLDAEGELAVSLEAYSAAQLARTTHQDMQRRTFVVDRFIAEGKVGDTTPIDIFLDANPDLDKSDRQLVTRWKQSFIGLFAIQQVLEDGFELMNWTTAKQYQVKQTEPKELEKRHRLGTDEVILAQISPLSDSDWMFFSPWISLGKLGKPKLAVAIGNFKQNYKSYLYSDAPDLLAEAWKSVEQHHQNFVDFFGDAEVTLPGYQLNKKLAEFQEIITQKSLAASGIDPTQSLEDLVKEAGVSQADIAEVAEAMGADQKTVSQLLEHQAIPKMVAPKVELPAPLKKAEQVTVLTDPRWGQMFLPTYSQFKSLLQAEDWQTIANAKEIVQKHLKQPDINSFVWHRLAKQYPTQMQSLLQQVLERPDFNLEDDLDSLLQEYGKETEVELPEIASVPLHLHNLFQEALLEVSKEKSKPKAKKKVGAGFQRSEL
ncbi:MAG: hypothetical protein HC772_05835 [Leptolyngbyaceae cyanobacterium CRU_2_3]|nr:hypothetical protein [Leptolyngbyaceae cyanobacterium CRU_2_3]